MEILLGSDCYIAKIEVLMSLRDDGIHCPTCAASVFFPSNEEEKAPVVENKHAKISCIGRSSISTLL
jgi:hypothetical protein